MGDKRMKRSRFGIAAMIGGFVGEWACSAAAQSAYAADSAFLKVLTERVDFTVNQIPALGRHLWQLPNIVDGRTALLLLGIVVVGLAAEIITRLLLNRLRVRTIDRLVGHSPLGAFGAALLLDVVALVALFIAGRVVLARLGDAQSISHLLGQQVFQALFAWRAFNLLFRAFLRPNTPEGRIAPVDDATARGLLIALNWVVVLPLIGTHLGHALLNTGATKDIVSAAIILYAPLIAACLLWVVWHWHKEMAAWLSAMVSDRKVGRQLKLDTARRWWMFGLAFYAALTESGTAARGLATIEGTLLVLLMFETLMHRVTRHIVSELPMAGDVVADCLRLIARLYAVILIADALMVSVMGAMTAEQWA